MKRLLPSKVSEALYSFRPFLYRYFLVFAGTCGAWRFFVVPVLHDDINYGSCYRLGAPRHCFNPNSSYLQQEDKEMEGISRRQQRPLRR